MINRVRLRDYHKLRKKYPELKTSPFYLYRMNNILKNRRALVCGSTQGIGYAAAYALAEAGASLTLIARNEESLQHAVVKLPSSQSQVHDYLVADFSIPESLSSALKKRFGNGEPVHILVNNTGGPPGGPITEATTASFEKTFQQHLICNHILMQAVLPSMKKEGYGRIINIISTSVKQPLKGLGVSNTIRAAVANWSKTLAGEVAPFGITVNNVLPGATETARLKGLISVKAEKTGKSQGQLEDEMKSEIPMGRFATPEEIAAAVVFLASPSAAYITGINLPVDGGRTGCL
jgi:3-oxoacyl-[acyl-carrier protein] reductase